MGIDEKEYEVLTT